MRSNVKFRLGCVHLSRENVLQRIPVALHDDLKGAFRSKNWTTSKLLLRNVDKSTGCSFIIGGSGNGPCAKTVSIIHK